jgi:hypothetical protein
MSHRFGVLIGLFLSFGLAVEWITVSHAATPLTDLSDAELEKVLSKGKITRKEAIGTGVTNPKRFWIERDGVTVSASFKDWTTRNAAGRGLSAARPSSILPTAGTEEEQVPGAFSLGR